MGIGQLRTVPSFLSARSPKRLRELMIQTNARFGMFITYFDIQFAEGRWVCWYNMDILEEVARTPKTVTKV